MNILSIFSILLLRIVFILYFFVDIENLSLNSDTLLDISYLDAADHGLDPSQLATLSYPYIEVIDEEIPVEKCSIMLAIARRWDDILVHQGVDALNTPHVWQPASYC